MSTDMIWKVQKNDLWKKPEALIGLMGNKVAVIVPIHDPRDANWDGKVGTAEWLIAKVTGIGSFLESAELSRIMKTAAINANDGALNQAANKQLVKSMFVGVTWGIRQTYLTLWAKGVSGIATSQMTNAAGQFFVRQGLETAVKASYDAAVKSAAK